jgi:hypothetical protein
VAICGKIPRNNIELNVLFLVEQLKRMGNMGFLMFDVGAPATGNVEKEIVEAFEGDGRIPLIYC